MAAYVFAFLLQALCKLECLHSAFPRERGSCSRCPTHCPTVFLAARSPCSRSEDAPGSRRALRAKLPACKCTNEVLCFLLRRWSRTPADLFPARVHLLTEPSIGPTCPSSRCAGARRTPAMPTVTRDALAMERCRAICHGAATAVHRPLAGRIRPDQTPRAHLVKTVCTRASEGCTCPRSTENAA